MRLQLRAEKLQNVTEQVKERTMYFIKFSEAYMELTDYLQNEKKKKNLYYKIRFITLLCK